MTVRDTRHAPFCWQAKPALAALRAFYYGERLKQRSTAIAVYVALTEAASNQHQQGEVAVIHLAIADATGTSRSTIKRYLSEFEAIGLIAIERRKVEGGANLPNVYFLLNLPSTHERQGATGTNGVPSTHERQGATGGLDQEETIIKNDPISDDQFQELMVTNYRLPRAWVRALAAEDQYQNAHGQLLRAHFQNACFEASRNNAKRRR